MTKKTISIWAKKNFIYWFIDNYRFVNEYPVNILQELIQTEEFLSRLKLVMNGSYLRPLIVISTEGTGMPPLLYKTNDLNYTDLQTILEHLYSEKEAPIFLTLYFPERSSCEAYLSVIEENHVQNQNQTDSLLIDFELSLWFASFKRERERAEVLKLIDRSLAEGNKRQFGSLVKRLKKL
ncbi:MAG: YpiB family protein [Bacteroidota bacterium]